MEWFIDTIEIGDVKLPELQNKVQGMRYKKQKCTMGIRSSIQTKVSHIFLTSLMAFESIAFRLEARRSQTKLNLNNHNIAVRF